MLKFEIIKVDNKNYIIYDDFRKNPKIIIPKIISPFGKEIFNDVQYVNYQIDGINNDLLMDINKTEQYFKKYIKDVLKLNIIFKSSIKHFKKYKPLWKVRLNKQTSCSNNNKESILIQDFNFKLPSYIIVSLHSLWISEENNEGGLLWILDNVESLI